MRFSLPKLWCLFLLLSAVSCVRAQLSSTTSSLSAAEQRAENSSVFHSTAAPSLPPLPAQDRANFDAAIDSVSPLTAQQIGALRERIDQAKRAAATHPTVPPKPVYSVQTVDLSPGAAPPIVRVSQLGAAVTFIDSTGAPWNILEVNNMAATRFQVLRPVASVPTITVTSLGDYVEGDVAVFLKDLPFPVVIKMIAGQRETDYRLDIRVPRRGPNAAEPIYSASAIELPNQVLQSLLDGTEGENAQPIRIQNGPSDMKAWRVGESIMLRTRLFLNNPAYYGLLTAADGTRVYEIPLTPVITVSEHGTLRNIFLEWE